RLAWALRVADTAADPSAAALALERAAAIAAEAERSLALPGGATGATGGREAPVRSTAAATLLRAAAAAHARAADELAVDRCLRAAVAADAEHLASVVGLRRACARRRDLGATVEACAWEARVVRDPAARVRGLLRAAELARHDSR